MFLKIAATTKGLTSSVLLLIVIVLGFSMFLTVILGVGSLYRKLQRVKDNPSSDNKSYQFAATSIL